MTKRSLAILALVVLAACSARSSPPTPVQAEDAGGCGAGACTSGAVVVLDVGTDGGAPLGSIELLANACWNKSCGAFLFTPGAPAGSCGKIVFNPETGDHVTCAYDATTASGALRLRFDFVLTESLLLEGDTYTVLVDDESEAGMGSELRFVRDSVSYMDVFPNGAGCDPHCKVVELLHTP